MEIFDLAMTLDDLGVQGAPALIAGLVEDGSWQHGRAGRPQEAARLQTKLNAVMSRADQRDVFERCPLYSIKQFMVGAVRGSIESSDNVLRESDMPRPSLGGAARRRRRHGMSPRRHRPEKHPLGPVRHLPLPFRAHLVSPIPCQDRARPFLAPRPVERGPTRQPAALRPRLSIDRLPQACCACRAPVCNALLWQGTRSTRT